MAKKDTIDEKNKEILEDAGIDTNEYAKKENIFFIYKGLIVKSLLGCFSLIFLIVASILLYQFIKNLYKIPEDVKPVDVIPAATEPPKVEKLPLFGYIKDKSGIWSVDINGKNRKNHLELSNFNQKESYTALTWKKYNELTYSYCSQTSSKPFCRIYTYNTDNKSQTLDQSLDKYFNISSIAWSQDLKYIGFIAETDKGRGYYFKAGTVITLFASFNKVEDDTRTKARVFFTDDNEYVIYYSFKKDIIPATKRGQKATENIYPFMQIYRVNGTKVDEFKDAQDPFLIDNQTIGYKKKDGIYFKRIGQKDESLITKENGFNPVLSLNKDNIAYWNNEQGDQKRVVMQIYDTKLNIRRDILRGIILPIWLSDTKIAGIRADNCFEDECLLFEFQTAGLVVIDIQTSMAFTVDQGAFITNVVYNNLPIPDNPKPTASNNQESEVR